MKAFLQQTLKMPSDFITVHNYRRFLFLLFKYGNAERFVEKKISFNNYCFTIPDVVSFVWQYKEIMVDRCYDFKTNATHPVIYDCGANVGLASLFFAKQFPDSIIKAFEADKNISVIAQKNLAANKVINVEIINKAVWVNTEELSFASEGADGGSLISDGGNKQMVQAIRLRDWLERETRVDMLKMDIEGAESEVILDCENSLSHVQHLFLEYHSYSSQPQMLPEILGILKKNGLRFTMENNYKLKQPFLSKNKSKMMDVQLNIYAYRD